MKTLLISPGYPGDMPEFVRGLAECGAQVIGVGDQHAGALPDIVRRSLAAYIQVRSLWDSGQVIARLSEELKGHQLDRVECLWEPGIMLAAEIREHFGIEGLNIAGRSRHSHATPRGYQQHRRVLAGCRRNRFPGHTQAPGRCRLC